MRSTFTATYILLREMVVMALSRMITLNMLTVFTLEYNDQWNFGLKFI